MPPTRKLHLAYLSTIALIAAALVAYDGVRRTTAGAGYVPVATGNSAPSTRPSDTLRLGIFNIASGTGKDGHFDLSRTRATLAQVNADVVSLQEVRPGQTAQLNAPFSAYAPSERRYWRDDFGNAFLSRLPIDGNAILKLPLPQTQERGHRNVTLARVTLGPATVTILGTHVDRERDQQAQLAFLETLFLSLPEPAVLMGDMNVTVNNPTIQHLLAHPGVQEVGPPNPHRIELILTRGLTPVAAAQLDLGASDHPMVWADVRLPAAPK